MTAPPVSDPELEQVAWDLSHLLDAPDADPGASVDAMLSGARQRAEAFARAQRGQLGSIDRAGLAAAMRELGDLEEAIGRAFSYAALSFSTNTADPARGALLQRVQEQATQISTLLVFWELEWAALDDARVEELLAGDELDFCRHHLRSARRYRPHLLSEPEEKIMSEKAVTGRNAWDRLFEEQTSAIEVELPDAGEPVPLEVALSRLSSPDREVRRTAAEAVTAGLAPGLRTRAYVFNTLLADKALDDRLRGYPTWLSSRNLANEASDESVQALVSAVRGRYELPQRWYALKARLLGLDRLVDYDRNAAVSDVEEHVPWADARDLVLDCYAGFSPDLGNLVRRFFDEAWVDAPLRPGKRGGAFCSYTVPSVHPYVMLNYTAKRRDVLTLAHELGHGVHAALGGRQGVFHMATPLTLAETASVFGETIVFGRLLERAETPESRLDLLASSIEGSIATVFRQVAMNHFEDLVHTERRERGELAVDRFNELWAQSQAEMLGDAVEITEGYRSWWSYVPHFISTPGYVYAYAYGQLLALSVYARYEEEGDAFVPAYLQLLEAGGSRSPEELTAIVGIDLTDPGFWDRGLDLVERQLTDAEDAARQAGRA
ncbi:MAG TPA: M3 family oligoendopeptidase [Solirubrobacteraceae bacterium]|nr:M3 family oligoendopeptidase [Solirubrobacteraceae bacterium]